jgi:hypothetical protein
VLMGLAGIEPPTSAFIREVRRISLRPDGSRCVVPISLLIGPVGLGVRRSRTERDGLVPNWWGQSWNVFAISPSVSADPVADSTAGRTFSASVSTNMLRRPGRPPPT